MAGKNTNKKRTIIPTRILKRSKKRGLPPGTLVHVGEERQEAVKVTEVYYDPDQFSEIDLKDAGDCATCTDPKVVTWINVDGIHEVEVLQKLGDIFSIHPLVLEDIVNPNQRAKLDDYEEFEFLVLRMLYNRDEKIVSEQISLILGHNYVISFQEARGDVFDPVRERIRNSKGRIRKMGSDYLAYTLMDSVVDNYFAVLESLEERIEQLELDVYSEPEPETLRELQVLNRELVQVRRSVWPLREMIGALSRGEAKMVHESTLPFLRDVHDHVIQVLDTVESMREMVTSLMDTYMSVVSNKMNEVMKVLTIIATIFIPLSFLAGVYGMNFENMPELGWPYAYYAFWAVVIALVSLMLILFARKKWI